MTRSVLRKELAILWLSPLPWVVGALFNGLVGLLYVDQLRGREQALLQPLFPLAAFLLLLAVPVLAMRSFAEEKRTGSLDLLLAIPAKTGALVAGKWLAAFVTAVVVLAPTLLFAGLVFRYGDPDAGPLWSGYLGLVLLAAAVAGIGILASSLTNSQPVAAMVALFAVLLLWFSDVGPNSVSFGGVLAHFSLSERLRSFAGGAVDSGDVVFLAVLAAVCLVLAGLAVRRPRRAIRIAAALGVVAALAAVDLAAERNRRVADLTAEKSLSLTDTTKDVVRQVEQRTTVNVFLPADDPDRSAAGPLLLRYERLNRKISARIKDPSDAPGEVRRFGLDPSVGGVAVQQGDEFELADTVTEQDVTGAIVRLLRGRRRNLCAATGHGEPAFSDDSAELSEARQILTSNGYTVQPIDLLASPTVPPACDALVMVNPVSPLGEAAQAVSAYLAAEGRLLLLTDPVSTVDYGPILSPYALTVHRGIVIEAEAQSALPDDPTSPIVRRYTASHPAARKIPPTIFPGVQAVEVGRSREAEGLITSRLADTSEQSFLEQTPFEPKFDEGVDTVGPLTIAAAAEKMRVEGDSAKRTRIVVVGDFDFASNGVVAQAGNSALLLRSLDWLTASDDEVLLSTNLPAYRPLALSKGQLDYARLLAAGIVPALFLLAGAMVWALRRSR